MARRRKAPEPEIDVVAAEVQEPAATLPSPLPPHKALFRAGMAPVRLCIVKEGDDLRLCINEQGYVVWQRQLTAEHAGRIRETIAQANAPDFVRMKGDDPVYAQMRDLCGL